MPYLALTLPRPRRRHPNAANAPVSLPGGQDESESRHGFHTCYCVDHPLGFAMQGRMNAQYGSFLPVACFSRGQGRHHLVNLGHGHAASSVWPVLRLRTSSSAALLV